MSCLESLPTGWKFVTLEEVATEFRYGTSAKTSVENQGVPVLRMGNLTSLGEIKLDSLKYLPEGHPDLAETGLREGDLLFNRTNSFELVGKSAVYSGSPMPCSFASYLIRVRLGPRCFPKFLAFALNSHIGRSWIKEVVSQQVGQANVNGTKLRSFRFPLPPIDEQHHIVAEIEKQFTRLDAAESALSTAAVRLKRYRSAALEAATGPSEWKRVPLSEISEIQGGIQKQPKRTANKNAYPFLRVANVLRGSLDLEDVHMVELFAGELDRLRLRTGDLLIVEGNGSPNEIGRMAVWNGTIDNCVHQNHLIRARLNQDMSSAFVSAFWNSPSGRAAVTAVASSTSGLYTLSVRKVGMIPVPKPSLDEQMTAVARIERQLSLVDDMAATLQSCLKRARRLRQSILSSAFRARLYSSDALALPDQAHEVHAQ